MIGDVIKNLYHVQFVGKEKKMASFLTRYVVAVLAGFILTLIVPGVPARADDAQHLKSMISELETKVEDADKRMVAHPSFLNELREILKKYKSRLREVFFRESFSDGNYTKKPRWTVKSGAFKVSGGALTSSVQVPTADPAKDTTADQNKTLEQEAVGLILDSIFGTPSQQQQAPAETPKAPAEVKPAFLYTHNTFPPAFEMSMRFKSSPSGEMDILLLGGKNLIPRYRLKVRANHSDATPMEVIRETGSRQYIVGASDKFPVINDGKFHTLTWVRLTNGEMNVLIDKVRVLQTYEVYYRDNFTGLGLVNTAGNQSWDDIEIFKALPPESK